MLASITVVPLCSGDGLKEKVGEIIGVIDESGLPYRTTGDWDEVMAVVKKAHETGKKFADRVLTHIAIDDRTGAKGRLDGKIKSVENVIGKKPERRA